MNFLKRFEAFEKKENETRNSLFVHIPVNLDPYTIEEKNYYS